MPTNARNVWEVTFQGTLQGQPVFNVGYYFSNKELADYGATLAFVQAFQEHLSLLWGDLMENFSAEYVFSALSVRRVINVIPGDPPVIQFDIPDVFPKGGTGDIPVGTSQPLPASQALYARWTTEPDAYAKRFRLSKYFAGFVESQQDDGSWVTDFLTSIQPTIYQLFGVSQEVADSTLQFCGFYGVTGETGWQVLVPGEPQLSTIVTHQDRRRKGTARGGYFSVG